MLKVFVEFSLVGNARRFETRLNAAARRQLHAGDTVVVYGDDSAPAHARVVSVADDNPEVQLELIET